ncbi:PAS domain-containing protein [Lutibacter sp. HS1-25]|uniref:ATP-binding protein n=1 Tax=Lutibacter sp. HS1-25 TaxID=2485000 RepID=UPI001010B704|nr:ATP-binding protein [Lutibacter sp. HS1-25]RXP55469.1 PAS domain-containing protein [Lutibacter sp. HS1-25]
MTKEGDSISIDNSTFLKLRRLYLLAFLLIAASIVIAQILIQKHLNSQLNDSRIVNIAGRQRMLSQKLVKEVLYLNNAKTVDDRLAHAEIIKKDNETFLNAHIGFQNEFSELRNLIRTSQEFRLLFAQIEEDHHQIITICSNVYNIVVENSQDSEVLLSKRLNELAHVEGRFLRKMDEIVFKYDAVSQQKVANLKQIEYVLLLISFLILLFEILFLFKPISIHIKKVIADLMISKGEAQEKAQKIEELYIAKEASLQELQHLNYALDNAALFASVTREGTIVHMSKKFNHLLGVESRDTQVKFEELLQIEIGEQQTIKELLKGKRHSIWVGELQVATKNNEKLWLEMSIIPMNHLNDNQRVLILCNDITKRKNSQKQIDELNEQRFKEQVNLQKIQASQIVEAQEEERKRIAKDIHDGIGQMLTALKFNIESINASNIENTEVKVGRLKDLLGTLIKEVRAVTFNLTPPELVDYGIVPTIQKLADRLSDFTGKKIFFENKTNFKGRFDSLVETNLYRVVQEAVNNSLKYAESNFILISISHSAQVLSIVIDDDGKGFDPEKLVETKNETGMGLFFMRERIHYINGRIFINTSKNNGTRITININLPNS